MQGFREAEKIDPQKVRAAAALESEACDWTKKIEAAKLTRSEIKDRVQAARAEMEKCNEQLEAVQFDIFSDDIPNCLDRGTRVELEELAERVNPVMLRLYETLNECATKNFPHHLIDEF